MNITIINGLRFVERFSQSSPGVAVPKVRRILQQQPATLSLVGNPMSGYELKIEAGKWEDAPIEDQSEGALL